MMPVDTYANYPMNHRLLNGRPANNLSLLRANQLPETLSNLLCITRNTIWNINVRNIKETIAQNNIIRIIIGLSHLHIVGSNNTASVRLRA